MKTGEEIYQAYQEQRDFSGSKIDAYAQNLTTFLMHAQVQNKTILFYQLLAQAEMEHKIIGFKEPEEHIFYDDYPIENLIFINKDF
jgi:hypothetical protein